MKDDYKNITVEWEQKRKTFLGNYWIEKFARFEETNEKKNFPFGKTHQVNRVHKHERTD